jgi:predicted nucleic acid-binding protein
METYVADAHALVWYLAGDSRLSKRVGQIFEQAEDATVQVLIPTIVLAEITHIAQRKKVKVTIDVVLKRIEIGSGFVVVPFDLAVFQIALKLPDDWEIHDRIIAATALYYGSTLITKDKILQVSDEIDTLW